MLPGHLKRNPHELKEIHKLISAGRDHPVLMINENAYTRDSGYPDGEPYQRYMAGLESVVRAVGGAILWRVPVLGQPVGAAAERVDEILGIWYPSHQAYLDVPSAEGGEQNYQLRALCVERALIHRCPGESFEPATSTTGAAVLGRAPASAMLDTIHPAPEQFATTNRDPVEPVLRSIAEAERHLKSEYGTKMVGVMDTIAAHPHFAMMLAPGTVKVCSGRDEVDAMYKASVDFAEPRASRLLSQLATDWYVFIENVPTRLWIAEGVERTAQTVNIFMSDAETGLSGEYAWQRYYSPADASGDGSASLPTRALANLKLHEALLEAMCAGNKRALLQVLDPTCLWAQRNYLSDVSGGEILNLEDAGAVARHVGEWQAALRPEHVSILNRKVSDWFVFSEELWVVRPAGGARRQYRTASIYPVNAAGKFEGALGFGKDIEPISPSASTKLGLSLWPPGVAAVPVQ